MSSLSFPARGGIFAPCASFLFVISDTRLSLHLLFPSCQIGFDPATPVLLFSRSCAPPTHRILRHHRSHLYVWTLIRRLSHLGNPNATPMLPNLLRLDIMRWHVPQTWNRNMGLHGWAPSVYRARFDHTSPTSRRILRGDKTNNQAPPHSREACHSAASTRYD